MFAELTHLIAVMSARLATTTGELVTQQIALPFQKASTIRESMKTRIQLPKLRSEFTNCEYVLTRGAFTLFMNKTSAVEVQISLSTST
jgi:hypothetical protein